MNNERLREFVSGQEPSTEKEVRVPRNVAESEIVPAVTEPDEDELERLRQELQQKGLRLRIVSKDISSGTLYATPPDLARSGITKYSPRRIVELIQEEKIPGFRVGDCFALDLPAIAALLKFEQERLSAGWVVNGGLGVQKGRFKLTGRLPGVKPKRSRLDSQP